MNQIIYKTNHIFIALKKNIIKTKINLSQIVTRLYEVEILNNIFTALPYIKFLLATRGGLS